MGFISGSNKIILNAFLTQAGRAFYLNGSDSDKTITHFGLGDSDTNYFTSATGVNGETFNNTLETGFIPDVTGNYNSCIQTVADGVNSVSLVNYQSSGITNTLKEVRMFSPNTGNYNGTNLLNIKVDIGKYIKWLKTYSKYSTVITDNFNINQPNLSSSLINFYDFIGVYDLVNKSIDQEHNFNTELPYGDYKIFEQLNRFLVDSSLSNNFRTVIPAKTFQSSPLSIIFSSKIGNSNNHQSNHSLYAGQGQGGLVINNRNYVYLVNPKDFLGNFSTGYTVYNVFDVNNNGLNLDNTFEYRIIPGVVLGYYQNAVYKEEIFKLREDYGDSVFNKNFDINNQYLKYFVSLDNTISLATREAQLLESFVLNRTDLFYNKNGVYFSNPINIYINGDSNCRSGSIKISLYMDTNNNSSVAPGDKFLM